MISLAPAPEAANAKTRLAKALSTCEENSGGVDPTVPFSEPIWPAVWIGVAVAGLGVRVRGGLGGDGEGGGVHGDGVGVGSWRGAVAGVVEFDGGHCLTWGLRR